MTAAIQELIVRNRAVVEPAPADKAACPVMVSEATDRPIASRYWLRLPPSSLALLCLSVPTELPAR